MTNKFNTLEINLEYDSYELEIKEFGNPNILRPSYIGKVDIKYLIEFYGLNESDVAWYKIYGVKNDNKELIKC